MDREQRNLLRRAVEKARKLLEGEVADQLEGIYNILPDGTLRNDAPGDPVIRSRLLDVIAHHRASGSTAKQAVERATREMAFTILNRFAALKMCEQRGLVRECITKGPTSDGVREVADGAPGLRAALPDGGYRLILEAIMDELSLGLKVLFDRRSPTGLIWPRPVALDELLATLNGPELAAVWGEDETIGWIYQYFNPKEERETMRQESAAPRNSHELAVRNQFFTPRYVVEFLVDNTLGRIWYEMRKGDTALKDSCRYLAYQPNEVFLNIGESAPETPEDPAKAFINHHPKKDPRDLKILDPACGSGHFLLYCFGLLQRIYEEAWEDGAQPLSEVTGKKLRSDYLTIEALRREVPILILKHNLYGVEIDPRAAQIASLALWLRTQRAYGELSIRPVERPTIQQTNIVVAEPIPGDKELLKEFTDPLSPPLLGHIVMSVFDGMRLAGEAGSLLKVEQLIESTLKKAKAAWLASPQREQLGLFPEYQLPKQGQLDLSGITDEAFWRHAEEKIYGALRDYAESAENGYKFRRALFANDAAQGFAFIDVSRQRYDVILMNPPFGDPSLPANAYLQKHYVAPKHDVASSFIERALEKVNGNGRIGCITTRAIFFLSYLAKWRSEIVLGSSNIYLFADCGYGVLDATVETALSVLGSKTRHHGQAPFFRTISHETRERDLARVIQNVLSGRTDDNSFVCDVETFQDIPRAPFAYWVSDSIRRLFSSLPPFESEGRIGVIGALSQDDYRFVRTAWETDPSLTARGWTAGTPYQWVSYSNGGSHTPVYCDSQLRINWKSDGAELKAFLSQYRQSKGFSDQWTSQLNAYNRYFGRAITWSSRPSSQGSFWILPAGCIFGNSGPAVFCTTTESFLWTLGMMNAQVFRALLGLLMPRGTTGEQTLKYELGYVRSVPIPSGSATDIALVGELIMKSCRALQALDSFDETSQIFYSLVRAVGKSGPRPSRQRHDVSHAWEIEDAVEEASKGLAACFDEIDAIAASVYGLSAQQKQDLLRHSNVSPVSDNIRINAMVRTAQETSWGDKAVSFLVGTAFGRWDVRYATGEKPVPSLPDPFAPLPVCAPGQLQTAGGLPAGSRDAQQGYPIDVAWEGILVDDPNHSLDISRRVRQIIDAVWGEHAESVQQEICESVRQRSLREYLRKSGGFFADHLKRYSRTGRAAPIYWPLSTTSGGYTVWLYYPRMTGDTLYKVVSDHVGPTIANVEGRIAQLEGVQTKGEGREQVRHLRELGELAEVLTELRSMREELLRVAKLPYKPDLNDGVHITAAPLWQLFRLPRWRNELEKTWKALERGEFDWAHLAYAIWPERVKEKCKTDRSLAIAHGLESLYHEQSREGVGEGSRRRGSGARSGRGKR